MSENNIVPSSEQAGAERAKPGPELVGTRQGLFHVADAGDTAGFGGLEQKIFLPGESSRPYGGWFDAAVDALEEDIREAGLEVGKVIERVVVDRDELTLFISKEHIVQVCKMLRDDQDLRFEMCLGVNGVHYPADAGRELHACYMLLSFTHGRQLRMEVTCSEEDPTIPSVVSVYPGNDWHERETWDLMGIVFTGHPSLTRTALPDDWVGHPQRKDYPLGGIPVQYKGATVPPADVRRSYN
ncbi:MULTISPECIES: NADH-quinone oxidoreductase subunit C [Winkia]|uniref:NADH-quinone oxidoreductase subunit C n=1 Tax=Winkia neuii subsp. anitrata TaxID=29318 RepID=A0AB38XMS1_9ACTO|nr:MULTISPECIES: NADH-quinone oxidoreductase subunit C [Winkia]PMC93821.1 NADH-quinone oxidoreductase subunit C [Actinomyces sp. UMB0918]MDK6240323.1 NADH-quinone oxidoreductase subunit C [Winkia sp. UMB10116]MDK7163773.1 NADH-quinone oxidoreductase subunit C [Winkia sp. UMB3105]MDK8595218.1 NADH-quinone oxidoreductase subunit C [Winkia sp. UMB1096A]MDU2269719.1 NADH-quinone oxidoreductase subunit C [Winkia neuii]